MDTDTAGELHQRLAIHTLHCTYAELLDTGRAVEVGPALCTPDVVWDHGAGLPTVYGPVGVSDFLVMMTSRFEGTMHVLTNTLATLDGGRAHSRTYFQAYHWLPVPDGDGTPRPADFVTTGVYVDDLEHTDAGWRIARRLRRNVGPSPLGVGRLPDFMHGIGGRQ